MFEPWILWSVAYILVGVALLWFVDEIPGWYKSLFIVWPVLILPIVIGILQMILIGIYEEIEELIRYKQ